MNTTAITFTSTTGTPVELNLSKVYATEQRIPEIAFITPHKAPELLARFNEAFLDLVKYIPMVKYELVQAKREANKRRSIVLLDLVPEILKAKGLTNAKSPAGSEDLRRAILETDEEYERLCRQGEKIEAIIELLEGKLKALEWAYTATKKIVGENAYSPNNTYLKAAGDGGAILEQRQQTVVTQAAPIPSPSKGFGKPAYHN